MRVVTATQQELFENLGFKHFQQVEESLKFFTSKIAKERFRGFCLEAFHQLQKENPELVVKPSQDWRFGLYKKEELRDLTLERFSQQLTHVQAVLNRYHYDLNGFAKHIQNPAFIHEAVHFALMDEKAKGKGLFSTPEIIMKKINLYFHTAKTKDARPFHLFSEDQILNLSEDLAGGFASISKLFVKALMKMETEGELTKGQEKEYFLNLYEVIAYHVHALGFVTKMTVNTKADEVDYKTVEADLIKILNAKNWKRWLTKAQRQIIEHINIACGEVSRKSSMYVSTISFFQWQGQQAKNKRFAQQMELVNIDNEEETAPLWEQILKSSSNPQKKAVEISVQNNGILKSLNPEGYKDFFETQEGKTLHQYSQTLPKVSEEYQGVFYTLTAPSKYHAVLSSTGEINSNWNHSSPADTHRNYLNKVWQRTRAIAQKYGIKTAGLRVAEPHHDGTPHWHLLLHISKKPAEHKGKRAYFIQEERSPKPQHWQSTSRLVWLDEEKAGNLKPLAEWEVFTHLFQAQAMKEDGLEAGAEKHRFKVKILERRTYIDENGNEREISPASYLVKYIKKNIPHNHVEGFSDETEDFGEAQKLTQTALNAACWASVWCIRQFQFIGNTQVSLWREARRYHGSLEEMDDKTKDIFKAADNGDFGAFLLFKGTEGVFTKRKDTQIHPHYEEGKTEQGLPKKSINGIQLLKDKLHETGNFIKTRLKKWKIVNKRLLKTKERETFAPWDCVTNCNQLQKSKEGEVKTMTKEEAKKIRESLAILAELKQDLAKKQQQQNQQRINSIINTYQHA